MPVACAAIDGVAEWALSRSGGVVVLHKVVGLVHVGGVLMD
jgi:hypothetical protein